LEATLVDGQKVQAFKESQDSFDEILTRHDVDSHKVKEGIYQREFTASRLFGFLFDVLPAAATVVFFVWMFRQSRKVGADIFNFGKARARLFSKDKPQVKFSDAAGVDEAKRELQEVVDFLKNPQKYQQLGARVPKGVLLVGPAGTGKTLLARATASEAGVPFFSMAGSEFMEMLVGVGPSRVRDLFNTAKQSAPAIIFIDEIESIGRHRALTVTTHGEQEQTLNQILTEMDGFDPNTGVIVLAATNQPQLLDPALVRPGRFDRRIVLDLPDIEDREAIIKIHMRGKPFARDVNIPRLAQRTVGFSGADLENMLNEAAILAAREERKEIRATDLEASATKVELGPERKRLQSDAERKMSAYHEAGHAVVSFVLPHTDPVHRVSIVSRGLALGYTQIVPQQDRYNQTKTELLEKICTLLGGRAAEELQFKEMTIGAGNDLERASQIARAMVVEYGMSELGPLSFSFRQPINGWPYNPYEEQVSYSDEMASEIDAQVKKIIDECFARARKILAEKKKELDLLAAELVKRETIEGEEFKRLMSKGKGQMSNPQVKC
jgi:cell division protease FtsH